MINWGPSTPSNPPSARSPARLQLSSRPTPQRRMRRRQSDQRSSRASVATRSTRARSRGCASPKPSATALTLATRARPLCHRPCPFPNSAHHAPPIGTAQRLRSRGLDLTRRTRAKPTLCPLARDVHTVRMRTIPLASPTPFPGSAPLPNAGRSSTLASRLRPPSRRMLEVQQRQRRRYRSWDLRRYRTACAARARCLRSSQVRPPSPRHNSWSIYLGRRAAPLSWWWASIKKPRRRPGARTSRSKPFTAKPVTDLCMCMQALAPHMHAGARSACACRRSLRTCMCRRSLP